MINSDREGFSCDGEEEYFWADISQLTPNMLHVSNGFHSVETAEA